MDKEESEYAAADAITVPSGFCARSFEEMGVPSAKLRKISYGVDLRRFSKQGDPGADTFEVLFVGQVSFRKGVPYLLAAFDRLKHPHKQLRIVGAMQPEVQLFLREKQWDRVEFTGPLPQEELVEIMSQSHVMVLPSIEDGLGLVLGQAMACGCPCICSTNTGGEDLFTDGKEGFVVPIRDPGAITACLEELCQDPARRDRMSESARQRVKAIGGWEDYGNEFGRLCHEITAETAEAPAPQEVIRS
jgi:glycosyltransferase involved in cell wall biosynthesis